MQKAGKVRIRRNSSQIENNLFISMNDAFLRQIFVILFAFLNIM